MKIGSVVKVKQGESRYNLYWNPEMDKFVGRVFMITGLDQACTGTFYKLSIGKKENPYVWVFHKDWLELVAEVGVRQLELD